MPKLTEVYRSSKKQGAYLYVAKGCNIDELPAVLKTVFGRGELTMTLLLKSDKKLATTTGEVVLKAIEEQGFYLQLPPQVDTSMQDLAIKNSKLPQA